MPVSDRDEQGEEEHRHVHRYFARARGEAPHKPRQHVDRAEREEDADHASSHREQRTLGKQLTHEPSTAGAERRTQREFPIATEHARQRKARHVRARDKEDQARDAEQNQQQIARTVGQRPPELERRGLEARAGDAIHAREIGGKPLVHGGNCRCGLLVRDAGAEASEDAERPECAPVLRHVPFGRGAEGARQHGHVDVVLLRIVRHIGQDADNSMRPVVHLEYAPDNRRIGAELLAPIPVAEDEHRLGARLVVRLDEASSEDWRNAEEIEEIVGDHAGVDAIRLAAVQQIEVHLVVFDKAVEHLRLRAIVVVLRDGDAHLRLAGQWGGLTHDGQTLAVPVGQRLQQHAVDDAEDGGVGADAEPECEHGQRRIARALQQRASAIPHILDQLVEPDHAGVSFMPWPLWSEVVTWMCQELTES